MQLEYIGGFQIVLGRHCAVLAGLAGAGRSCLAPSFIYKKRLGLYGQLFDSGVGIAGVAICFFWLFTAIFASTVAPFDPLGQVPIMKDALPGAIEPASRQDLSVRRRQARARRVQPHGLSAARSC